MAQHGDSVTLTFPTPVLFDSTTVTAQVTYVWPDGSIDCLALDPAHLHDVFITGVISKTAYDDLPPITPDRNLPYFG